MFLIYVPVFTIILLFFISVLIFNYSPQVLSQRVSFLFSSIVDFREHVKAGGQDAVTVDILSSSVGLPCNVDPALVNALRMEKESKL